MAATVALAAHQCTSKMASNIRQIVICYMYTLPGPMEGFLGSLQTNKSPPGSKERKIGLNPSPLGTRSGANFEHFASDGVSETLAKT